MNLKRNMDVLTRQGKVEYDDDLFIVILYFFTVSRQNIFCLKLLLNEVFGGQLL